MKITLKCNPTVSDPNFAALGEPNKPKTYVCFLCTLYILFSIVDLVNGFFI